jgi:pyruvate dehydrogenase E2 component (dihydrolipoamide acetyltransferase)
MIREVLMPKLGQTMEEATVEKWHKKEGDTVERGEVLLEITTDKATLEVESYVSGTLRKIIAEEGVTLPVTAVIALVGDPEDALPANLDELIAAAKAGAAPQKEQAERDAVAVQAPPAEALPTGRVFASPRARMLAREKKVNLQLMKGSGPGGRIIEKDILDYAKRRDEVPITPAALELAYERGVDVTAIPPCGRRITKEDILAAPVGGQVYPPRRAAPTGGQVYPPRRAAPARPTAGKPLSAMRRVVAERMSRSKREIPHFYLSVDVDMTEAMALREKLNQDKEKRIAFHDLLIKACAMALREDPAMNAAWSEGTIVQRTNVDIGLAVALEEGLIVPVIRQADRRTLEEVAADSRRLIEKARGKRLTPDEYEGGGFTISNLGMLGIDSFLPIVNPGENAILGVGRIARKPVAVGDAIRIRQMMNLGLSADHRVVDGVIAAKFLARVKELLENPARIAGAS